MFLLANSLENVITKYLRGNIKFINILESEVVELYISEKSLKLKLKECGTSLKVPC